MASDGLWNVLSVQKVIENIAEANDLTEAAHALIFKALRKWKHGQADNISLIICSFVKNKGLESEIGPSSPIHDYSTNTGPYFVPECHFLQKDNNESSPIHDHSTSTGAYFVPECHFLQKDNNELSF